MSCGHQQHLRQQCVIRLLSSVWNSNAAWRPTSLPSPRIDRCFETWCIHGIKKVALASTINTITFPPKTNPGFRCAQWSIQTLRSFIHHFLLVAMNRLYQCDLEQRKQLPSCWFQGATGNSHGMVLRSALHWVDPFILLVHWCAECYLLYVN